MKDDDSPLLFFAVRKQRRRQRGRPRRPRKRRHCALNGAPEGDSVFWSGPAGDEQHKHHRLQEGGFAGFHTTIVHCFLRVGEDCVGESRQQRRGPGEPKPRTLSPLVSTERIKSIRWQARSKAWKKAKLQGLSPMSCRKAGQVAVADFKRAELENRHETE